MENIFLINSNFDLKCTSPPVLSLTLHTLYKIFNNFSSLNYYNMPGKVTPGCSQQSTFNTNFFELCFKGIILQKILKENLQCLRKIPRCCLYELMLYVPANRFSVMLGHASVFLV